MHPKSTHFLALIVLLAATLLGGVQPSLAQNPTLVALSSITVGVGDAGVVDAIIACGASACSGINVTVQFDPAMLRVDSIEVGPYLGQQVFEAANVINNPTGTATLAAAALGAPSATENVVFRLTVTGRTAGSTSISISALEVVDSNGAMQPVNTTEGVVTVVETGKTPPFMPPNDNWEVAFTSERDGNPEIYVMKADGTAIRRLTNTPTVDTYPTWSPGGGRIAFVSERDGNPEIYLMNADGSNQTRLTNDPAADQFPSWSPDGTRMAFMSERDGNPEIYVMNADGTNPVRLTNNPANDTMPVWAPNGAQIAFVSDRDGSAEIYLMNTDGTNPIRLTSGFGANAWYPAWSPDGRWISFTSERSSTGDIYVMDATGGNVRLVSDRSDRIGRTAWSPDGEWIARETDREANSELFVLDSNGTQLFRLTEHLAEDYAPHWRPVILPPCLIRTDREDVVVRVGPGLNRGVFTYLPPNQDFLVEGQALDQYGEVWWQLDKTQFPGHENVNSLWVAEADVEEIGACGGVPVVPPPPLIPSDRPQVTPGTWQPCGSCDTCGHPAAECVTAPDGQCLWDPATCLPDTGVTPQPGCYSLLLNWSGSGNVSSSRYNCDPRSYQAGTSVTILANPAVGWFVYSWSGTCPGLVTPGYLVGSQTITMTTNCSVFVEFGIIN